MYQVFFFWGEGGVLLMYDVDLLVGVIFFGKDVGFLTTLR